MVCFGTPSSVLAGELGEVESVDDLNNEASEVVLAEPALDRRGSRYAKEPVSAKPGQPAREDYEYERLGVCNVFMANEPLAGRRMTKVTERKTKVDWAHFVHDIAQQYPTYDA